MKEAIFGQSQNFLSLPPEALRGLTAYLPVPVASYGFSELNIDVYKAKHIHNALWVNSAVMTLSQEARKSYRRYGNVSLIDDYDAKAAVYLVSARYRQLSAMRPAVQEWLTVRFIPAAGSPVGYEDFSICQSKFGPLDKVIQSRLFVGQSQYYNHLASIAGVSAIRPYSLDPTIILESVKNRYTALSFMLANQAFLQDPDSRSVQYFTAVIHRQIAKKTLSVGSPAGVFPVFTPAHETLGLEPRDIWIDRKVWSYKAPGYFLNILELLQALERLIANGKLDVRAIAPHIDLASQLNAARKGSGVSHDAIRNLSSLLTANGPLPYSSLTGNELRTILDQEVGDAAQLTIMARTAWHKGVDQAVSLLAQPLPTGAVGIKAL